jgi:tRNA A-37 threonylcarbamoyl transferase component Bud32
MTDEDERPTVMVTQEITVKAPAGLLAGRYRIERELGRGGIGVVYLARDEQMESRPVVIKVLLERSVSSEWLQKKFRDEMKALVRVDHPGIVGVFDTGTMADGRPFLVMQYIRGTSLRDLMTGGLLPLREVADLVRQTGQALTAAHAAGVYHRDLKPENIMLQDAGEGQRLVKIIDFGIATVKDPGEATRATTVAGTPYYMAPEQLGGRPGAASDTYAMGVIAYELLTGRLPFQPSTPYELLSLQRAGPRAAPCTLRPELAAACDAILLSALSFQPEDRPPSARALGESLARALAGDRVQPGTTEFTSGVPEGLATPRDGAGRRRGALVGLVAVVALAGGVLAWRVLSGPGTGPAAPAALVPAGTPVTTPALAQSLTYFVTVQKYRDGTPYREPFRLPGEMLFGPDDRIRLEFSSPQAGHLYIVNEGPEPRGGAPSYNVLFPTAAAAGVPSALVPAAATVRVPDKTWFQFDEERGTERLWVIWAKDPVPPLEAVKGLANPRDRGVVGDRALVEGIRAFLGGQGGVSVKATRNEQSRHTVLEARGSVLVSLLKLEHH